MVSEIRIYMEGGGDEKQTKAELRVGMGNLLTSLRNEAREKRIRWNLIACGSREAAFDNFKTALRSYSDAFNVLLVDSEALVEVGSPWEHLKRRDNWANPGLNDNQCHLMAQAMEAWFIADPEALETYYGQGFQMSAIPRRPNVEEVEKQEVYDALARATRGTQKKEYHKTRHAPKLLEKIDVERVKRRAGYCKRLFDTLEAVMGS